MRLGGGGLVDKVLCVIAWEEGLPTAVVLFTEGTSEAAGVCCECVDILP